MPTLEQKAAAMRIRQGKEPEPLVEGKIKLAMWLLYRTQRVMTPAKLARRFGRSPKWVAEWLASGCPLD